VGTPAPRWALEGLAPRLPTGSQRTRGSGVRGRLTTAIPNVATPPRRRTLKLGDRKAYVFILKPSTPPPLPHGFSNPPSPGDDYEDDEDGGRGAGDDGEAAAPTEELAGVVNLDAFTFDKIVGVF